MNEPASVIRREFPSMVRRPTMDSMKRAVRRKGQPEAETRAARKELVPVLVLFGLLALANLAGLPYFILSSAERVRSPLHPWFRPTGYVGQTAGIVVFALFLFLWLYPLRKRFRRLAFTGSVARWLHFHVIAGLCIPMVGALHAAWHFTGLIGFGFGAMMAAWASGVVGRYLYVHIPHSKSGVELTLEEVEAQRSALLQQIVEATGLDPELLDHVVTAGDAPPASERLDVPRTFIRMAHDDFRRWRMARSLRVRWHGTGTRGSTSDAMLDRVPELIRRRIALTQQVRMLDATQRLFRYWHVAHKPMAISALVAVVLHVVTAVALGVTWFR